MTKKHFFCSKLALTSVFLTVFSALTFAQDLRFGLQASPSWSWFSSDKNKVVGSGSATGFKLGLILENRFSEAYSISSGIGFHFNAGGALRFSDSSQVWTNSWDEFEAKPLPDARSGKDAKARYNITYVEIPIGLKFRTPEQGNHIRWFAEPQVALAFRSGAKGSLSAANPIPEQDRINIKDEVAGLNLGWGIGGGAEYIIQNNTAIVIGLYYQAGFVDVTKDGSTKTYNAANSTSAIPDNAKNTLRGLTVRFGVMF
jgi:hypothetical protein